VEEGGKRRVMGYAQWGAFAEKVAGYSHMLWPVPEHWSDEQAAAFPVNFFTAYLGYWQAGMTKPRAGGGTHRVNDSRRGRRGGDSGGADRRDSWR